MLTAHWPTEIIKLPLFFLDFITWPYDSHQDMYEDVFLLFLQHYCMFLKYFKRYCAIYALSLIPLGHTGWILENKF